MIRYKTYVATGVAPDGRLFAGDMNLIQDLVAALADFTQNIQLATLAIGDSGLTISKYGSGEALLSGSLRTSATGILKGLGGIFAGTYTTTQRDAISLPPYGLIVTNTTTNQLEWNKGSAGTPDWQAVNVPALPPGVIMDYGAASAPTGWLICDGAAISRSTYAALFAIIGTTYGVGDGVTTFNLPDFRGRMAVGKGTHTDVDTLGETEGYAVGDRSPKHNTTGGVSGTHSNDHTHGVNDPGHYHLLGENDDGSVTGQNNAVSTDHGQTHTQNTNAVTTGITLAGASANHTHTIPTLGPGGSRPVDLVPYVAVNKIIKT